MALRLRTAIQSGAGVPHSKGAEPCRHGCLSCEVWPLSGAFMCERRDQIVLIVSFIGFSWLGMQVVHESGHVLAAWLTGAQIERVVLHPLTISQTQVLYNPSPLTEIWAGPLVGALLPLAIWLIAWRLRAPGLYLFRFFAGFCLVANGIYIGMDAFLGFGDGAELLRHGAPRWLLVAFGVIALASGFALWNRLGPHFGLGEAKGVVNRQAATVSLSLFTLVVLVEVLAGGC